MAVMRPPSTSFLAAFLPVVRATLLPEPAAVSRHWRTSFLPAALAPIPGLLGELWDGLLRAVPKKKTSHSKKRSRFLAGKALKDVTALNKCPGCGRLKRAHVACPHCVLSIKRWLHNGFKTPQEVEAEEKKRGATYEEERRIQGLPPRPMNTKIAKEKS